MTDERLERINEATEAVRKRLGGRKPVIGMVLGSGLGRLAEDLRDQYVIPYSEIPGFAKSTAVGHKGNLISGTLGGKQVLVMQGRFHYYEGYTMDQITLPIRVMVKLGIKYLFVSNAAGGVNPDFRPGDLMIIRDHINLLPNPLIGPNLSEFGPRFPDMTHPYDLTLIHDAREIGIRNGFGVTTGVYLASTGPTYETTAEYNYFRTVGADAVGMSTIPEVIVARHSDIPVFGVSIITNVLHPEDHDYLNDADDVVDTANKSADRLAILFEGLIEKI